MRPLSIAYTCHQPEVPAVVGPGSRGQCCARAGCPLFPCTLPNATVPTTPYCFPKTKGGVSPTYYRSLTTFIIAVIGHMKVTGLWSSHVSHKSETLKRASPENGHLSLLAASEVLSSPVTLAGTEAETGLSDVKSPAQNKVCQGWWVVCRTLRTDSDGCQVAMHARAGVRN